MLLGDDADSSSIVIRKQLITLLDHFIVYIGDQACILPKQAACERLKELANHDWKTSRCFLLAYLRSEPARPGRCEKLGSTPSASMDSAITSYDCADDDLADYMEIFESFIDCPDSEDRSNLKQFQDGLDCDRTSTSTHSTPKLPHFDPLSGPPRTHPSAMDDSSTNNRQITPLPSVALAFSKDDLKYVEIMSSWRPVIDYHPLHTPEGAVDSRSSLMEGSPPPDVWRCCGCGTMNVVNLAPDKCPTCGHAWDAGCSPPKPSY